MTEIYKPTSQQKIGCALGAHDWKEYQYMPGKYFCLRKGCNKYRGFNWYKYRD